jgi:uncharacterized protein YkwD
LLGTSLLVAALVASAILAASHDGDEVATTPVTVTAEPSPLDGEPARLHGLVADTLAYATTTIPPTTTTTAPPPPPPPPPPAPTPAPPPPPPPAPPSNAGEEARALALINGERANAGLPPLQISSGARSVARAWSGHMAGSGLAHNPDLSGDLARAGVTGWRTIGENVGYSSSVDRVHQLFMESSGHRANILKAGYTQVGIGVVHGGGKVWVTLDFVGY